MLLYRLAKTTRANDLSGEGAKRAGGRWNHAGIPLVYTAQSGSLAILEVLQYVNPADLRSFSMLTIHVPDDVSVTRITPAALPDHWQRYPYPATTKDIGSEWAAKQESLLLAVPSAVYPDEYNYLINPQHTAINQLRIVSVKPFVFNERLFGR